MGKHSPFSYAATGDINDIIIDGDAPVDYIEFFRGEGINVIVADHPANK